MSLQDFDSDEIIQVKVLIHESAYANARIMFDKYRQSKEKSKKTLESLNKAMQNAETQTKKQLQEAQKLKQIDTKVLSQKKQNHWFQKFYWFFTSDNYLVLAGRDAQQNEMLVKRYLRP